MFVISSHRNALRGGPTENRSGYKILFLHCCSLCGE